MSKAEYFAKAKALIMGNEIYFPEPTSLFEFAQTHGSALVKDLGLKAVCEAILPRTKCAVAQFDYMTAQGYKLSLVTGCYFLP